MQELAESGAKVLNAQAVEFAKERGIAIYARATRGGGETVVRKFPPRHARPGRRRHQRVGAGGGDDHGGRGRTGAAARAAGLARRAAGDRQAAAVPGVAGARRRGLARALAREPARLRGAAPRARRALRRAASSCARASAPSRRSAPGINASFANLRRACAARRPRSAPTILGVSTSGFRISLLLEDDALPEAVRALHRELVLRGRAGRRRPELSAGALPARVHERPDLLVVDGAHGLHRLGRQCR